MNARILERCVWIFALACAVGAVATWWDARRPPTVESPPAIGRLQAITTFDEDSLSMALRSVVASDPFRISRTPPRPADEAPEARPSSRSRPELRVSGIVGGPPWAAIIDGIPGRTVPAVVRVGEVYGTLRIGFVGPDSVIVAGEDTTWVLKIDAPWR